MAERVKQAVQDLKGVGTTMYKKWSNRELERIEYWNIGVMVNEEEQKQGISETAGLGDAVAYYRKTWEEFRKLPYELKRVASQQIASSDSVHRNIAEGYCRRSIHEYLKFLYIALGSLGESVSGLYACKDAEQIPMENFERLDELAFKLENGLLKLVQSLEEKRELGEWTDHLMIKESNAACGS